MFISFLPPLPPRCQPPAGGLLTLGMDLLSEAHRRETFIISLLWLHKSPESVWVGVPPSPAPSSWIGRGKSKLRESQVCLPCFTLDSWSSEAPLLFLGVPSTSLLPPILGHPPPGMESLEAQQVWPGPCSSSLCLIHCNCAMTVILRTLKC